jgi:hypothetical protein
MCLNEVTKHIEAEVQSGYFRRQDRTWTSPRQECNVDCGLTDEPPLQSCKETNPVTERTDQWQPST